MTVEVLEPGIRRILAPNPSPWTLEGTNTYLLGADGAPVTVIDPGPLMDEHLDAIIAAAPVIERVLLTHRHPDHAEAAESFAARVGAPVQEPTDGVVMSIGTRTLCAVATPGHASDHRCFLFEDDLALFSGDHILGRGTTVVAHPDGDMHAYLASLHLVTDLAPHIIFPGHGPTIDDPETVLAFYLQHRIDREQKVIAALDKAPRALDDILSVAYDDVPESVLPGARMSLHAHLAKLVADGQAHQSVNGWRIA